MKEKQPFVTLDKENITCQTATLKLIGLMEAYRQKHPKEELHLDEIDTTKVRQSVSLSDISAMQTVLAFGVALEDTLYPLIYYLDSQGDDLCIFFQPLREHLKRTFQYLEQSFRRDLIADSRFNINYTEMADQQSDEIDFIPRYAEFDNPKTGHIATQAIVKHLERIETYCNTMFLVLETTEQYNNPVLEPYAPFDAIEKDKWQFFWLMKGLKDFCREWIHPELLEEER